MKKRLILERNKDSAKRHREIEVGVGGRRRRTLQKTLDTMLLHGVSHGSVSHIQNCYMEVPVDVRKNGHCAPLKHILGDRLGP